MKSALSIKKPQKSNILSFCSSFADTESIDRTPVSKKRPQSVFNSYRSKVALKSQILSRRGSFKRETAIQADDYLPLRSKRDSSIGTKSTIEPTKMQPAILKKPFLKASNQSIAQQKEALEHLMRLKQIHGLDFLFHNNSQIHTLKNEQQISQLKPASIHNIEVNPQISDQTQSKPATPSILMISQKGSSLKPEDLITFQRFKKESTKSFSQGILSGSLKIEQHDQPSEKSQKQEESKPTEDTVKVDTQQATSEYMNRLMSRVSSVINTQTTAVYQPSDTLVKRCLSAQQKILRKQDMKFTETSSSSGSENEDFARVPINRFSLLKEQLRQSVKASKERQSTERISNAIPFSEQVIKFSNRVSQIIEQEKQSKKKVKQEQTDCLKVKEFTDQPITQEKQEQPQPISYNHNINRICTTAQNTGRCSPSQNRHTQSVYTPTNQYKGTSSVTNSQRRLMSDKENQWYSRAQLVSQIVSTQKNKRKPMIDQSIQVKKVPKRLSQGVQAGVTMIKPKRSSIQRVFAESIDSNISNQTLDASTKRFESMLNQIMRVSRPSSSKRII